MTSGALIQRRFLFCLLALLLASPPLFAGQTDTKGATPPSDRRVLIISLDGMRPDVLLRANVPNIRELLKHGSFTFWAESTELAITLPTHVSMLTGVSPGRHHITWNDDRKPAAGVLAVPTLFELAKRGGYSSSMVVGKQKLCIMAKPGVVECSMARGKSGEEALSVAARAVELLRSQRPQVMFVHFPDADSVGHASGWGSPEQLATVDLVDQGIGMLMATLREQGLDTRTLVIITADHGGSGHSHGSKVPYSRNIPWIAAGPGIREHYDLTNEPKPAVQVEDVFATAMHFLGIPIPPGSDGKPVLSIFGKTVDNETSQKRTP